MYGCETAWLTPYDNNKEMSHERANLEKSRMVRFKQYKNASTKESE